MEFGKEIRKEFALAEDIVFINHGAYGAVPRCVKDAQKRLIDEMDRNPDLWFRKTKKIKIDEARYCIAEFINSDPDDVVFVVNTTTGVNSVMKSIAFNTDDIILYTDNTYDAVKNTCTKSSLIPGVRAEFLTIKFPIKTEDDVVEMYRQYFTKNKVKVAVFDHISSSSAIKWPIEKLVPLCKEYGVLSLIDGAHAPGQIPLNMKELDPDFYSGNLHKWLFCPRGCAILYVKRRHQIWVEPAITGHGYKASFQKDFYNQATRDETPFCVVPEAVKFYKELGGYEKMRSYIECILKEATDLMTSTWGTEMLPIPKSMEAPFMKMVQLPKMDLIGDETKALSRDEQNALAAKIIEEYGIVASVTFINGKAYHRPNCNVYNTKEDYIKMVAEIEKRRI